MNEVLKKTINKNRVYVKLERFVEPSIHYIVTLGNRMLRSEKIEVFITKEDAEKYYDQHKN